MSSESLNSQNSFPSPETCPKVSPGFINFQSVYLGHQTYPQISSRSLNSQNTFSILKTYHMLVMAMLSSRLLLSQLPYTVIVHVLLDAWLGDFESDPFVRFLWPGAKTKKGSYNNMCCVTFSPLAFVSSASEASLWSLKSRDRIGQAWIKWTTSRGDRRQEMRSQPSAFQQSCGESCGISAARARPMSLAQLNYVSSHSLL